MIMAYMKVLRTIQSAEYQHLKNGSVLNLINNFGNMYSKSKVEHRELLSLYEERIKMYEQTN
jgi:hypothetical protein